MNENEIDYLFKDFMKKLKEELLQKFYFAELVKYRFFKNDGKLYLILIIKTSLRYADIRDYIRNIFNFTYHNEYYDPQNFEYSIQFKVA